MKFSQTLNRKQILVRRKRMCLCVKRGVRKGEREGRRERGREGGSKEEKKKSGETVISQSEWERDVMGSRKERLGKEKTEKSHPLLRGDQQFLLPPSPVHLLFLLKNF